MNYFEFHVGDWVKATRHLSATEEGVYLRLILRYYEDERPLPADSAKVQRLAGARTREERDAVAAVLDEFFVHESDGFHHRRCDELLAAYFSFCEKQANKARAGAAAKWSGKSKAVDAQRAPAGQRAGISTDARTMPEACPDDAPAMPFPSSHLPLPTTHDGSNEPSAAQTRGTGGDRKGSNGSRGSRIPDPFLLTADMRQWAATETPGLDLERATREFVDYWRGVTGKTATKRDWVATWRNRMRDLHDRGRYRLNGHAAPARTSSVDADGIPTWANAEERAELLAQRAQETSRADV